MEAESSPNFPTERQIAAARLGEVYARSFLPDLPEGPRLKVSAAVSTLASAYEKFRQAMEYNEPHLLRRAATERILGRRLRADSNTNLVAAGLVNELIRGRYLQNDFYPESLVGEIDKVVEKYRQVLHAKNLSPSDNAFSFLMRMASAEMEEFLVPPDRDDALKELMMANVKDSLTISDPALTEPQALVQLRVAIDRSLLKFDRAMLEFNVFELFYPDWKRWGTAHIAEVAGNLDQIRSSVKKILEYPLGGTLTAVVRRYAAPFILLKDALERNGSSILQDKLVFARAVAASYEARMGRERKRLATTTIRSLLYIFLTKAVLSFAFELPAEVFIYGSVSLLPFLINFLFPPFFLFLLTLSLNLPGEENEERILEASKAAVFGNGGVFGSLSRVEVKKRGWGTGATLFVTYFLAFILIFGGVSYLLAQMDFSPFAIALFLFYTSLVTYFGVRVRELAQELRMAGGRETMGSVAFDFVALPFLQVGKVVSAGLAKFNFLVLFVSLIVEAPIQTLLEFLEEWIRFAREKKEEVY
ncbi:MAG: hypothetical protein WEC39_02465 [Patescibacteria group bacterium]